MTNFDILYVVLNLHLNKNELQHHNHNGFYEIKILVSAHNRISQIWPDAQIMTLDPSMETEPFFLLSMPTRDDMFTVQKGLLFL